MSAELAAELRRLAEDPATLTALHQYMEDELIEMRDRRMFMGYGNRLPANGLVVREPDGSPSDTIRIGTRTAIEMILKAAADRLDL